MCLSTQETQEKWVWSLGQEDPLDKEMATPSSVLAWRTPWTEEPGGYSPQGHTESETIKYTQMQPYLVQITVFSPVTEPSLTENWCQARFHEARMGLVWQHLSA